MTGQSASIPWDELIWDAEPFRVTFAVESRGCTVATVVGEIDACTLADLRAAFRERPGDESGALVVDLSRVSFCSAAGLRLLLELLDQAILAGAPFALVFGSGAVRRPLEVLGFADRFPSYPDRATAVAAVCPHLSR
ncbi:anti-anti-sigma factor [Prauserella shujinwangii]|uniref:Anti-anti-sigma factor n=1 Tax=Prauserella shujinwangii TaxID=1453103 RepID=A0A2T0LPZ4_9PSEU|nr:STAS domain-containing protein [Prauserella shujinwangii]PRX45399.1 anti-anti-sigma factor [Prauserella shujinwangii]